MSADIIAAYEEACADHQANPTIFTRWRKEQADALRKDYIASLMPENVNLPEVEDLTFPRPSVNLGHEESGSEAWLRLRSISSNGSPAIGGSDVHKLHQRSFADHYRRFATPHSNQDTTITDYGNRFETTYLKWFADRTGKTVVVCKSTFEVADSPHLHFNLDGVLLDDEGRPEAVVEIKTSWDRSRWITRKGSLRCPEEYRAQVLYYLWTTGLERGYLIASICGEEPVVFTFDSTDTLKDGLTVEESMNKRYPVFLKNLERVEDFGWVEKLYRSDRPFYIVDLETTGFAKEDSVIQLSAVDARTGELVVDRFYMPDPDVCEVRGLGPVDVHRITWDDVKGQPTFTEAYAELKELFDGAALMVHNKKFESMHLEKRFDNLLWVDSMDFAKKLCPGITSWSLKSWVSFEGGAYPEDSHRADVDCRTTFEAFQRMRKRLAWGA